ncbi:MAG: methyltransferase domain-containing protein [Myxococcales bacterium]|nr:methyltransferase domain-containing protein [Myxococcales bacterium]
MFHQRAIHLEILVSAVVCLSACSGSGTSVPPPATAVTEPASQTSGEALGANDAPSASAPADSPEPPAPPAPPSGTGAELAAQVVAAPDRSEADRGKDALRHPQELLTFLELAPGMRIADLGAGSGYTTELLARSVGPQGRVYGQNIKYVLEKFVKESWPARLEKPVMANVVRVDSELDKPLPEEAKDLDRVTMIFFYHDAVGQQVDMKAMNAAIYAALKPGGLFVIADHSARAGSGTSDTKELHRIDPEAVKSQLVEAGFEFVESADFLRDSADTLDWKVYERGFKTDRFVLKFRRPN